MSGYSGKFEKPGGAVLCKCGRTSLRSLQALNNVLLNSTGYLQVL